MRIYIFLVLLLSSVLSLAQSPIHSAEAIHHPIVGEKGMVATQHHEATKVGLEILKQGGNAVDAAVGVGFALAVVLPRAGNLGGGGFMLIHNSKSGQTQALNYREMAPLEASRNMYLDKEKNVDKKLLNFSYQSAGVPGTVAGLCKALKEHGSLPLDKVLAPAIQLAENGFPITHDLARVLNSYTDRLRAFPETEKIFYPTSTTYYKSGDILIQKDLAWSLKQIAENGPDAFYKGAIAKKIAKDMKANNGLVTMKSLKAYKVEEAEVVKGTYRGYEVVSMPPPSSGGVHVLQMLNILENYPLAYLGHNSAETIHLMAEAMKLAYADRSEHLGDPKFWEVPVEGLISKAYANDLNKMINRLATRPSDDIKPGQPNDFESEETTHFTVVDAEGNVVSNTYTLNFSFGSGIVAKGTGILLNNEMSDFSAKPGVANAYGLLGGEANAVQPLKRPLSSMTPTLVFKEGRIFLATGSPGGSRIITTVLQVILNVIDHNLNIAEASHAPRVHHQWYPDVLYVEKGINIDTKTLLQAKKHDIKVRNAMGSTQSIMVKDGLIYGASDPRRPDASTLGF